MIQCADSSAVRYSLFIRIWCGFSRSSFDYFLIFNFLTLAFAQQQLNRLIWERRRLALPPFLCVTYRHSGPDFICPRKVNDPKLIMYCAYDENVVHLLLNSSINWLYSDRFRYSPRRDECPYWRPGTLACEKSARVHAGKNKKQTRKPSRDGRVWVSVCTRARPWEEVRWWRGRDVTAV
jgi:hypothetical protein